jgi:hypothetical protein
MWGFSIQSPAGRGRAMEGLVPVSGGTGGGIEGGTGSGALAWRIRDLSGEYGKDFPILRQVRMVNLGKGGVALE